MRGDCCWVTYSFCRKAHWPGRTQKHGRDQFPAASFGACGREKQSPAAHAQLEETKKPQETTSGGGNHEGIKVHGHWTIEVRNPDGALVTHREFENSIFSGSSGGATLLSLMLSRQTLAGPWEIVLTSGGTAPPAIFLDEQPPGIRGVSRNLSYDCSNGSCSFGTLSFSGGGFASGVYTGGTLTLTGTATAPTGFTSIGQVLVGNFPCFGKAVVLTFDGIDNANGNLNPPACATIDTYIITPVTGQNVIDRQSIVFLNFTSRTLDGQNGDPQPVPVSAGQTVAVTVTISFS